MDIAFIREPKSNNNIALRLFQKYSVAKVVGCIKGKSAIALARQFENKARNFNGEKFWAKRYAVSTVGFEEQQVKEYVKHQKQLDSEGSEEVEIV